MIKFGFTEFLKSSNYSGPFKRECLSCNITVSSILVSLLKRCCLLVLEKAPCSLSPIPWWPSWWEPKKISKKFLVLNFHAGAESNHNHNLQMYLFQIPFHCGFVFIIFLWKGYPPGHKHRLRSHTDTRGQRRRIKHQPKANPSLVPTTQHSE